MSFGYQVCTLGVVQAQVAAKSPVPVALCGGLTLEVVWRLTVEEALRLPEETVRFVRRIHAGCPVPGIGREELAKAHLASWLSPRARHEETKTTLLNLRQIYKIAF